MDSVLSFIYCIIEFCFLYRDIWLCMYIRNSTHPLFLMIWMCANLAIIAINYCCLPIIISKLSYPNIVITPRFGWQLECADYRFFPSSKVFAVILAGVGTADPTIFIAGTISGQVYRRVIDHVYGQIYIYIWEFDTPHSFRNDVSYLDL